MSDSAHRETARRSLEDELAELEAEIGHQRNCVVSEAEKEDECER